MIHWLLPGEPFPPVEAALREPAGLLAAGGDLSPTRLIDAYRHGIFPWFNEGDPVLWWSTDPRMVLFTDEFRISHSLRKRLVRSITDDTISIRCDTAFEQVITACAQPRDVDGGTWIVDDIVDAYLKLHRMGIAHSVETWIDDRLVGGLYGIAIGRMFYGESMFTRITDASKIALAHLVAFAQQQAMPMLDCQQQTRHLASMGARAIPRVEFKTRITGLVEQPAIDAWPERLVWTRAANHDPHASATTIDHDGTPA
ncbi:MAG: leucyl/phenylalanyl-tRNA--protein transferase [Burkholderiaceae bacterium]